PNSVTDPSGTSVMTNPTVSVAAAATATTPVSATLANSYQWFVDCGYGLISANHSLSISLPDTSAWGTGQVRIAVTLNSMTTNDGYGNLGTLSGYTGSFYAANGLASATLSFSETSTGYPVPSSASRNFSYALYKQTSGGEVYLGGTTVASVLGAVWDANGYP